jgi:hypothetical protein
LTPQYSSTLGQVAGTITELQEEFRTGQRQVVELITVLSRRAEAAAFEHTLPEYSLLDSNVMTRTKPAVARIHASDQMLLSVKDLDISRTSYSTSCRAFCSCQCHTPSSLYSMRTLANFIGTLSITHSGIPYLTRPCNQSSCLKKANPAIKISYRFPEAIAKRCLFATFSISDLAGPEMNVKMPRVVEWTSPVWQFATVGNVRAIENLFRKGLASPWDVSPLGGTLLHVSYPPRPQGAH